MKEEIIDIAEQLKTDMISVSDAQIKLFELFKITDGFIPVSEQVPPSNVEIIAKSPSGTTHLCNWRQAYGIFTVQCKTESSHDWSWKPVSLSI